MEQSPQSPFFINERKRRCASRTVDGTFRMLTRQLGLASVYGREPRLHDLRQHAEFPIMPRCPAGWASAGSAAFLDSA
jgi:hypothetical protein